MKKQLTVITALLFSVTVFSQDQKNKGEQYYTSLAKDKAVVKVLKEMDNSVKATLKPGQNILQDNEPVIYTLSADSAKNEFNELMIIKDCNGRIIPIFKGENTAFTARKKRMETTGGNGGGTGLPDQVGNSGGGSSNSIPVPTDGSWSRWSDRYPTCDNTKKCPLSSKNGIGWMTQMRIRITGYENALPDPLNVTGGMFKVPIIETQERSIWLSCGCLN